MPKMGDYSAIKSSFDLIWDSRETILVCAITISFCKYSIWIDSGEVCAVFVRLLAGFLDLVLLDCERGREGTSDVVVEEAEDPTELLEKLKVGVR